MKKPKLKDVDYLIHLNKTNQLVIVRFEKNTIKVSFSREYAMIGCDDGILNILHTLYEWGAVNVGVL